MSSQLAPVVALPEPESDHAESIFAGVSHVDAWVEAVMYDGNHGELHIHNGQVLRARGVSGQMTLEELRGIEA